MNTFHYRKGNDEQHYTEKPYECLQCGSQFSHISNLRKHYRRFHEDKLEEVKNKKAVKAQCQKCFKLINFGADSFKRHDLTCKGKRSSMYICVFMTTIKFSPYLFYDLKTLWRDLPEWKNSLNCDSLTYFHGFFYTSSL